MIHFEDEIARFDTGLIGLAAGLHTDHDDTVGIAGIVLAQPISGVNSDT